VTEPLAESRVDREAFLRVLELTEPGLAQRETLEQSSCYCFVNGEVITFNEELSVRGTSGLDNKFNGAVRGDKLLESLRKLTEEQIVIAQEDGKFVVRGKKRKFWVRLESEVTLPYTMIEVPDKFKPLPDDFSEAVQMVSGCCATSDDGSNFNTMCLNIAPGWVEACDTLKMCRWNLQTNFKEPCALKYQSTRPIHRLGVTQVALSKSWLHFKNARGFTLSARKYLNDWPSDALDPWLDEEGEVVSLPKGLKEACEKSQVFTMDNGDSDLVSVALKATRVIIKGEGPLGGYEETSKVEWSGPEITFLVSPKVLSDLVDKYSEVIVTPRSLKIQGGSYTYCTRLSLSQGKPEED
jgi:hypothetical protein